MVDMEVLLQVRIDSCQLSIDRLRKSMLSAREDGDKADERWYQGQLSTMEFMRDEFQYLLSRVKEG